MQRQAERSQCTPAHLHLFLAIAWHTLCLQGGQKACFCPARGFPEILTPPPAASVIRSGSAAAGACRHGFPPGISRGSFHVHALGPESPRPVFEMSLECSKAVRLLFQTGNIAYFHLFTSFSVILLQANETLKLRPYVSHFSHCRDNRGG